MHPLLLSEKQRLDSLFKQVSALSVDDELFSHWSRYLCVLVSGFIENSMKILIDEYAKNKSHPNIRNYISNKVKGITNLNEEKIFQLLGSFNSQWRQLLEAKITDEQKDAIDSIVANRHNIVHGRSVGITLVRIKEYYERILKVIYVIETECFEV